MASNQSNRKFKTKVYGIDHHEGHWETHEWNLNTRLFRVYLFGEVKTYHASDEDFNEPGVEYQMASRFIKNLDILSEINPSRPILIRMKTCGGYWEEGMAIYNAIKFCPNKIVVLSETHARSMSSLILQAADKRVLMPDSYFMIHDGTTAHNGTVKQFQSFADFERRVVGPRMLDIYVDVLKNKGKHSRKSREHIQSMLRELMDQREDVYFTAEEAVDYGFADEVFDGDWERLVKRFPREPKTHTHK